MSKCKTRTCRYRSRSAMSITELVVAMCVIGIAVAGITELTWFNAMWSVKAINKMDNVYAARTFMERIGREIRQATSVEVGSSGQTLVIDTPLDSQFDSNGYPTGTTPVTYSLVQDSSQPGSTLYEIQVTGDTVPSSTLTVLRGIVGPIPVSGSEPTVFQYVDRNASASDPNYGIVSSVTSGTTVGSVIINLEMRRQDFGNNDSAVADSSKPSIEGLRAEYFLRNGLGLM